ncbi:MAG: MBL fold metallo-hydrolase [Desulfobacterales bacterium]|nr:MAG: MBL fold metallo-hydrolase [Desulfobacterales bacterium]
MTQHVIVKQIPVGSFQVMTYLVVCPQTRESVIIDPAGDEEELFALIQSEEARIKYILNTHAHADHTLGNAKLKHLLSAPVCMHETDDQFFSDRSIQEMSLKELGLPGPDSADIRLKDKDVLKVGMLGVEVIHTPGHTPGSVCYLIQGHLFTGDTLFVGAAGRTDLIGGSLETLIESLEKLIGLPKETVVWPGHDYGTSPSSTIGREMEENPYITDFILD